MYAEEELYIWGHPNVRATHPTTLEITKEDWLTPRGDCIIGVRATKAGSDFGERFRKLARRSNTRILLQIKGGGVVEEVWGWGHPKITLNDSVRIIARRSRYVCDKTLMVAADKAAKDISRKLVGFLQNPRNCARVVLRAFCLSDHEV